MNDEFGGPCNVAPINGSGGTPFVHTCATVVPNILASQNYIDFKNVRHSVYRTGGGSGHVKGQIQGALSNNFSVAMPVGSSLARLMGAPTGPGSGGIQSFEAGYLQRDNGLGIRVNAYACNPTCTLRSVLRWDALGIWCPSLNPDRVLTVADQGFLAQAIAEPGWQMEYDLNQNGFENSQDMGFLASRIADDYGGPSNPCISADPP